MVGPQFLLGVETMEPEEGVGRSSVPVELSQVVLAAAQVLLTPQLDLAAQDQRTEAVPYPVAPQLPSAL